ncbi:translation-associated GTPase [Nitzschia inconspicua]|uniref:Translation-associated GTPase n=1 Tax=Nitzschia inconspicua TaxID=303405 RepID=A0A9K3LW52_9STRA|nr:translation-associated GTPase [Nitzschia inconspicua]
MSDRSDNEGKTTLQTQSLGNHRRRRNNPRPPPVGEESVSLKHPSSLFQKTIVLLHGNQQSGQLFLGRLDRLRKRMQKDLPQTDLLAIDAPHLCRDVDESATEQKDRFLLTWWHREGDDYVGLEESLKKIQDETAGRAVVGILGFSQGARFAHLLSLLHTSQPDIYFPHLRFVILAAGYDAPLPPQMPDLSRYVQVAEHVRSLHIWGVNDTLISPDQSEAVSRYYYHPVTMPHSGKHFVPSKANDVERMMDFIQEATKENAEATGSNAGDNNKQQDQSKEHESTFNDEVFDGTPVEAVAPDDDVQLLQQDEVQALEAIFPEEIQLKSSKRILNHEEIFEFPIIYHFRFLPSEDIDASANDNHWPPLPLMLRIQYPHNYPMDAIPIYTLIHENTVFQFPSRHVEKLMCTIREASTSELRIPSVLSAIYAARDFLDSAPADNPTSVVNGPSSPVAATSMDEDSDANGKEDSSQTRHPLIRPSSPEDIEKGNLEGLEIAESLLRRTADGKDPLFSHYSKGGGSFGAYTIGLVGKPSAGKSTFFNAATAFSRQRGQQEGEGDESEWGGASMATHPFTTIDPNIGYCLVPAPPGSCPEDDETPEMASQYGSTHGRDPFGRRFLPVLLKDVAGLVPGAYQGKGRGNQFLNDLTDATVLIHVADASGSADSSGNKIVSDDCDDGNENDPQYSNPIDDLAWIRRELVEWVYSNLMAKWDVVARKGRSKLAGMFSGYGQRESMVEVIFDALETYLEQKYHREKALDHICSWSECDIHRVVSLFLGVRFPMAICLNKFDLPSAKKFVDEIVQSLPLHGAHAGVPLSARAEMNFVKKQMSQSTVHGDVVPPFGVWKCLTAALMLREPVLVFPVSDLLSLAPLPGLNKYAVEDASLPSKGMIRCIEAAGGVAPSCWNKVGFSYAVPSKTHRGEGEISTTKLRDALMMKPGSTVEDVFLMLKRLGALSGEFVRAEACSGAPGDKPKPVPKAELVTKRIRVIKIMSNKRTSWQTS